jgi:hypothetical protein
MFEYVGVVFKVMVALTVLSTALGAAVIFLSFLLTWLEGPTVRRRENVPDCASEDPEVRKQSFIRARG